MPSDDSKKSGSLARAALHPAPLAVMAIAGLMAVLTSWLALAAGAIGYIVGVALIAGKEGRPSGPTVLREPRSQAVTVRSTEVMAHVVRIRKAHDAMYRGLCVGPPSLRKLVGGHYDHLCDLVQHAYGLAAQADRLRATLDATASTGTAPQSGDHASANELLAKEYREACAQLVSLAAAMETWQLQVQQLGAGTARVTEIATLEGELEQMDHLVRGLSEAMRG